MDGFETITYSIYTTGLMNDGVGFEVAKSGEAVKYVSDGKGNFEFSFTEGGTAIAKASGVKEGNVTNVNVTYAGMNIKLTVRAFTENNIDFDFEGPGDGLKGTVTVSGSTEKATGKFSVTAGSMDMSLDVNTTVTYDGIIANYETKTTKVSEDQVVMKISNEIRETILGTYMMPVTE